MRILISATLAVSGVIHAHLYIHGYRHIPTVGRAFLLQASEFYALAVLILVGAPACFRWARAVLSLGTLIAFARRTPSGCSGSPSGDGTRPMRWSASSPSCWRWRWWRPPGPRRQQNTIDDVTHSRTLNRQPIRGGEGHVLPAILFIRRRLACAAAGAHPRLRRSSCRAAASRRSRHRSAGRPCHQPAGCDAAPKSSWSR
jgi:hypothetical protein